jgi:DAK2 domain fusion protein YloV
MSAENIATPPTGKIKIGEKSILDGQDLKDLFEAALAWMKTNQATVNALNVFPVPDGDTGTNMLLTMQAAYAEIANQGERNIGKMAHMIAQGALMGARGNSGVILSQLFRGLARGLDNLDTADVHIMAKAFTEAKITAYKGVVRPVEGTILTVAKDAAAEAERCQSEVSQTEPFLARVVEAADRSVEHTPELLPVLKSAGVVDSGGKGLFYIFEGMLRHCRGQSLDTATGTVQPLSVLNLENAMEDIEPGQDWEVVVDFRPEKPLDLDKFYNELTNIGTSIQLGEGDGMYRMHIHVSQENENEPERYIDTIGTRLTIKKENLVAQMAGISQAENKKISFLPVEPGQIAVVAVSPGEGISRIFASLGAAAVIPGGQTMNPSTEDILKSFENLPTDRVIILPNNKNIVLAAQAAASYTVKKVAVIPSISVPQGLSAMLRLAPEGDLEDVVNEMRQALTEVETGEITTATRSVELNGVSVKEGQVIALHNGALVYAASSLEEACLGFLAQADTESHERITLFYGADLDRTAVNRLVDKIRSAYKHMEIEVHEGNQPHYQFIISIE